jgi:hypothetical protein
MGCLTVLTKPTADRISSRLERVQLHQSELSPARAHITWGTEGYQRDHTGEGQVVHYDRPVRTAGDMDVTLSFQPSQLLELLTGHGDLVLDKLGALLNGGADLYVMSNFTRISLGAETWLGGGGKYGDDGNGSYALDLNVMSYRNASTGAGVLDVVTDQHTADGHSSINHLIVATSDTLLALAHDEFASGGGMLTEGLVGRLTDWMTGQMRERPGTFNDIGLGAWSDQGDFYLYRNEVESTGNVTVTADAVVAGNHTTAELDAMIGLHPFSMLEQAREALIADGTAPNLADVKVQ